MSFVPYAPCFSVDDAVAFAKQHYGLRCSAHPLPSDRDQNFRLTMEDGEQVVLKIANAEEVRAVLDLQNRVMQHLAKMPGDTHFPEVLHSLSGDDITAVQNGDGTTYMMRLVTYLPGIPLAKYAPHSDKVLSVLGTLLGVLDHQLAEFEHPAMHRDFLWDLKNAGAVITNYLQYVTDPERHALVEHFLQLYKTIEPKLTDLRQSLIHGDANDYNVLVESTDYDGAFGWSLSLIDFGDLVYTHTINELAIAAAYVMLDKPDPITAVLPLVKGYYVQVGALLEAPRHHDFVEQELEVLYPLICARLCTSGVMSSYQKTLNPDNDYLSISETPVWDLLHQLKEVNPRFAHYAFRAACGFAPDNDRVANWLRETLNVFAPVVAADLAIAPVFDLSVGSPLTGQLTQATAGCDAVESVKIFTQILFDQIEASGAIAGIGRYAEARVLYAGEQFAAKNNERRTIHTGMDIFMAAGSPVYAPLDAVVHCVQNNDQPYDYGPTIILEHTVEEDLTFYTLYGHLGGEIIRPESVGARHAVPLSTNLFSTNVPLPTNSFSTNVPLRTNSFSANVPLRPGDKIKKGQQIATIGDYPQNGNWPPHLHVQIITDMLGKEGDFPGVCAPSQKNVWLGLSPDPNLILQIPKENFPPGELGKHEIAHRREKHIGKSLSLSYQRPLKIVRGFQQYLYDDEGRAYLDAVNNVPHVGHSHPHVVKAAQQQMTVLNTNTRYLHPYLVQYAERLCATLPDELSVCFFVNSGSEANDLAMRLARTHTGADGMIVLDSAYHGNLSTLIDISPYKFDSRGGQGAPPHVQKVPTPDGYRGLYKGNSAQTGAKYAAFVRGAAQKMHDEGRKLAAFYCESLPGCGGQIVLPDQYMAEAQRYVHEAGGVLVADEVQVGFGRVGTHFWGFQTQNVVPDIVTMGKPIGNGHPLAAVVTTPAIAASFNNGMEYFNTFGGNPVSCAIGMAVLDVIENEQLQRHARDVGEYLLARLENLKSTYAIVGDVRGLGLYVGVELVLNRETLEPAASHATYIANRMRECGILISTDGPLHNVLKIKPPLVFTQENAELLVKTLEAILSETVVLLPG